MKFDSNQAWTRAIASIGAGRNVIWPVAGIFFLLPGLITVWFFSDIQASMLANIANPRAGAMPMNGMAGKFFVYILLLVLVQSIGNMSILGLFTDRARPTVGEAISNAVRSLPTIIGALLLMMVGYAILGVVIVTIIAGIAAATKLVALAVVLGVAAFAALVYVMTKLSLLTPVIVIDQVRNPVTAITRSWSLTKGNSARLFLFYLLLAIGYLIIAIVVQLVLGAVLGVSLMAGGAGAASLGGVSLTVMGLVSGVLGMIVAVVLNAVLAAVHSQLSGPSAEAFSEAFE